ncbi:regulatory protein RecX [Mangrovimonas aestuarii]|uniref:regulatory protein RecX n=1 Tax=Mangrovimonas aestuarii TaxID=3018443 RepID=UPI002378E45D|nr:regulatory protein RecX [Mangrovimonas aestuarii]
MFNKYKTFTVDEAISKMEHFCAYQERCHQEVRQKLVEMRMIPEAMDMIVGHLLQNNFLNEERFSKTFVRGKFRIKKWGKRRLIQELKKREISKFNINLAIREIEDGEYLEVFNTLIEKRWESVMESDVYKKKKKVADYMLYRGWESSLVYEKLSDLG